MYCLHKDTAVPTSMLAWPEISGLRNCQLQSTRTRYPTALIEAKNVRAVACHNVALEITGRRSIVEHGPELVTELISVRRLPSAPGVEANGRVLVNTR